MVRSPRAVREDQARPGGRAARRHQRRPRRRDLPLVIGAITLLLRACEEADSIRPGLAPDDVLLVMGFLWRIDPSRDWEARASRLLDLVMDGLRAGTPTAT
jgi:hypothetical protein